MSALDESEEIRSLNARRSAAVWLDCCTSSEAPLGRGVLTGAWPDAAAAAEDESSARMRSARSDLDESSGVRQRNASSERGASSIVAGLNSSESAAAQSQSCCDGAALVVAAAAPSTSLTIACSVISSKSPYKAFRESSLR